MNIDLSKVASAESHPSKAVVANIENTLHPQPPKSQDFGTQLSALRQWQVEEAKREEAAREAAQRAYENMLNRVAARVQPFGTFSSGYAFGNCTYYVASRIPVPNEWGNANTWADFARSQNWTISSNPVVGAIAQTSTGYYGHVAIVESVNGDGTITISEMNYAGGFDFVDTRVAPVGEFEHYIY